MSEERDPELGRVKPPYGGLTNCQSVDCGKSELNEENGAYLHKNLRTDKLVMLCGPCSQSAELVAREWLPLLAL